MSKDWSNLARVVYARTYSRNDNGVSEKWDDTVDRVIGGNVRGHKVAEAEIKRLRYFLTNRKATPAGRGLWYSGSPGHEKLGGVALNNCWGTVADDWTTFVLAQDLLMLGGGVGMSVEHQYVSKLPRIKKDVKISHKPTKDADFIVPDSREGWNKLTYRVLEAYFVTGKSFCYSTVCVRGAGEPIRGFGGKSSGPGPLVAFVEKLASIFLAREGRSVRPIDAADILCSIAEMVVSGNVRRSALLIAGDPWDKIFLKAKRWDLGSVPSQRANANFSVVAEDVDDLHPLFWETYQQGEPFGIVNRTNIRKFGRMGELRKDTAIIVNPCVSGDTPVLTQDGYRHIDSLIGQEIQLWNGSEWSLCKPRQTGTDQKMVLVTLSDGRFLRCTPGHEWIVSTDYRGSTSRVSASDLKPGDKCAKYVFPAIAGGDDAGLPDAYTQGFVSAEGMDNYAFLYVYWPKDCCLPRLKVKPFTPRRDDQARTYVTPLAKRLKSMVPEQATLKYRLGWFAGLLDGDGCVLKEGGSQISSIDHDFLLRVQRMLSTMGVNSKVTKMRDECVRAMPDGRGGEKDYLCKDTWRVLLCSQDMQDLVTLGLNCSRLVFNHSPNRNASRFATIESVTDAGFESQVYCFEEKKRHLGCFNGIVTGQCAEATLENKEPCNLQEIPLPNLSGVEEFEEVGRLMHRWGKRVTMEKYHHNDVQEVVDRNRRVGTGITGCLQSPELFNPTVLDRVYAAIQDENVSYSNELGINQSIRTTVIKPSGTLSKVFDVQGEGLHCGFARWMIQRIRFAANDNAIPKLRAAGHRMEPVMKFDGSLDHGTLVVDFYIKCPVDLPTADEGFNTWKQLDTLLMAQKHWADQAVSVTVYYRKDEIPELKVWLANNLKNLKTISFLCWNDHGFKQAPKEAITEDQYEQFQSKISPISMDDDTGGSDIDSLECASGGCPIK